MGAVDDMIACLGAQLVNDHIKEAMCRSGAVFLSDDLVYLICEVGGEFLAGLGHKDEAGERSALILYIGGNACLLKSHRQVCDDLGFTHFVWHRGFKKGTKAWRRARCDKFFNRL